MSYVNINMEDVEGGQISMNVVYHGDFNPKSHAHQHAHLLTKYMDRLAKRVEAVAANGNIMTVDSDQLLGPEEGEHAPTSSA